MFPRSMLQVSHYSLRRGNQHRFAGIKQHRHELVQHAGRAGARDDVVGVDGLDWGEVSVMPCQRSCSKSIPTWSSDEADLAPPRPSFTYSFHKSAMAECSLRLPLAWLP